MKVVVLGGPEDGKELDVPPGTTDWRMPVPQKFSVADVAGGVDVPAMPVKIYRLGKIRSADNTRMKAVLIEPTLQKWMEKK